MLALQKKIITILVIVIPCVFAGARLHRNAYKDDHIYTICDQDKNAVEVVAVSLDPEKPKNGDTLKYNVTLNIKEKVTSGEVKVSAKYGEISILDETLDLCDLVTQINKQCPLEKGILIIANKKKIPDYIPAGKYTAKASVTDQNGKEVLCVELSLTLDGLKNV